MKTHEALCYAVAITEKLKKIEKLQEETHILLNEMFKSISKELSRDPVKEISLEVKLFNLEEQIKGLMYSLHPDEVSNK